MKPSGPADCNRVLSVTEDTDVYRARVPVRSKGHRHHRSNTYRSHLHGTIDENTDSHLHAHTGFQEYSGTGLSPLYTRHRMPYVK